MGKTIVFSWKIDSAKYGYLCGPENGNDTPIVCDRITTKDTLKEISDKVSEWDLPTYTEKFNLLKEMISQYTQGATISGNASDYYYENTNDKNYIVLTGKDGHSSNTQSYPSEDLVAEIKKYIDKKFYETKDELMAEMNSFTAKTDTKIEHVSQNMSSQLSQAESQIEQQNDIMMQKLEDATTYITSATKIFDLEAADITVEKLSNAIENSSETKMWKDSAENKIVEHDSLIGYCKEKVDEESENINTLSQKVDNYRSETIERIGVVANEVEKLDRKVENISAQSDISSEDSDIYDTPNLLSKSGEEKNDICEIDTFSNDDGTFDVNFLIGNESFTITIFGHGKTLNNRHNNIGLTLANNGFKYMDVNNSFISIIDGIITLSNKDGSGKLEIKNDGVYINGVKK